MSVLPTMKAPKFTLTLPVSKTEVKARPFLIKEQKILLQAMELGDKDQVINALDDIMNACTFDVIDIDKLPVPDVEYLMLNIRAKSSGNEIKLSYTCHNMIPDKASEDKDAKVPCGTKLPAVINISDVKIDVDPKRVSKLIFDDDIGIQLRDIPYGIYKLVSQEKDSVEKTMKFRNSCIESVFDADTVWTNDQFTAKDVDDFVDHLYTQDYDKIEEFIKTMPILKHTIHMKCPICKHSEDIILKGLDDFLV